MNAITMYRGDSYPIIFTIRNKKTGEIIDLSGTSLKLTVDRKSNPTAEATKVFSCNGIIDTTIPATGKVTFTPSSSNTSVVGSFYYDIQMTNGSTVRTIEKDTFTISQDITK